MAKLLIQIKKLESYLTKLRNNLFALGAQKPQYQEHVTAKLFQINEIFHKIHQVRLTLNYQFLAGKRDQNKM